MKMNLQIKFVFSLFLAILVAIFAIQNAGNVEINFLFAKFTISQALVILVSAIFGAIIVLFASLINQLQQSKKIKRLRKDRESLREEKEKLEENLNQLRLDLNNEKNILAKGEENFINPYNHEGSMGNESLDNKDQENTDAGEF